MMVYDNLINHIDNNGNSDNYDDNGIINTSTETTTALSFAITKLHYHGSIVLWEVL